MYYFKNKILVTSIFFITVSVFLNNRILAQDTLNCAIKLQNAQTMYDNGLVGQIPDLLKDCLVTGFSKEEELAAYKLIIMSYLFNDNLSMADSAMLGFLKKNPEYEISPTDHTSFIYLYNKFEIKPVIQLGGHFGTNMPFLNNITSFSLSGSPSEITYSSRAVNLFLSLEAKFKLTNKLDLSIEPGYSQLSFTRVEQFYIFEEITYTESQQRIEIPVSLTYDFKRFGNFSLFGRMGLGAAINLKLMAEVSSNATDLNNPDNFTGEDVNRKDSRIKTDVFAQIGTGIKYKIPHGFISAEVRANFGFKNQTVRGGASAEALSSWNNYIDDYFNLNTMNFNIGYIYVFYKPLKKDR